MKFEFSQQIFENVKSHENPSSGNRVVSCGQRDRRMDGQADRQTDRLDELWVNDQLDAQLRYIDVYYYNPLHVSSITVLIIRRSHCINTASGIVFPVSDRSVSTPNGHLRGILYQMLY